MRPGAQRTFTRTLLRVDKYKSHNLRQLSTEQIKNEGKIVRILLNLLWCCIKQIMNVFIRAMERIFSSNIENIMNYTRPKIGLTTFKTC